MPIVKPGAVDEITAAWYPDGIGQDAGRGLLTAAGIGVTQFDRINKALNPGKDNKLSYDDLAALCLEDEHCAQFGIIKGTVEKDKAKEKTEKAGDQKQSPGKKTALPPVDRDTKGTDDFNLIVEKMKAAKDLTTLYLLREWGQDLPQPLRESLEGIYKTLVARFAENTRKATNPDRLS